MHSESRRDFKVVGRSIVQIAIVVVQGEDVDQDVLLNGTTRVQWNHVHIQIAHIKVGFIWRHPAVFEGSHTIPDTS